MLKKSSELTPQELALVVARHEDLRPHAIQELMTMLGGQRNNCQAWSVIGPIWEREADKFSAFRCNAYGTVRGFAMCFVAVKSPESICRALVDMWHPNGVEI